MKSHLWKKMPAQIHINSHFWRKETPAAGVNPDFEHSAPAGIRGETTYRPHTVWCTSLSTNWNISNSQRKFQAVFFPQQTIAVSQFLSTNDLRPLTSVSRTQAVFKQNMPRSRVLKCERIRCPLTSHNSQVRYSIFHITRIISKYILWVLHCFKHWQICLFPTNIIKKKWHAGTNVLQTLKSSHNIWYRFILSCCSIHQYFLNFFLFSFFTHPCLFSSVRHSCMNHLQRDKNLY